MLVAVTRGIVQILFHVFEYFFMFLNTFSSFFMFLNTFSCVQILFHISFILFHISFIFLGALPHSAQVNFLSNPH